jgi:hypothetical protein
VVRPVESRSWAPSYWLRARPERYGSACAVSGLVAALNGGSFLTVAAEGVSGAALVRNGATLAYAVVCPGAAPGSGAGTDGANL